MICVLSRRKCNEQPTLIQAHSSTMARGLRLSGPETHFLALAWSSVSGTDPRGRYRSRHLPRYPTLPPIPADRFDVRAGTIGDGRNGRRHEEARREFQENYQKQDEFHPVESRRQQARKANDRTDSRSSTATPDNNINLSSTALDLDGKPDSRGVAPAAAQLAAAAASPPNLLRAPAASTLARQSPTRPPSLGTWALTNTALVSLVLLCFLPYAQLSSQVATCPPAQLSRPPRRLLLRPFQPSSIWTRSALLPIPRDTAALGSCS